jgi:acyl-CoA synthetase (AMP-forming)/AMP-acid ligase II
MNIGRLLSRAAERHPRRPAWGAPAPIDYATAESRVNRVANALLGLGLLPGDRVGMVLWNRAEAIEVMMGVMRAGLVVVPLNVRLHPEEITLLLTDAECSAVVYGAELAEQLAPARERVASVRHWIQVGKATTPDPEYEAFIAQALDRTPSAEPGPEDLAWIFYTSGTTGTPKGAMLSHRNLLALTTINLVDVGVPAPTDVLLHAIPISHAGGFFMLHHIAQGAAHVFLPKGRFDPEVLGDVVSRNGVTTVALLPTMINTVLGAARAHGKLKSIHTLFYGGSPMPAERLAEGMALLGRVFVQSYGLGEAPLSITVLGRDEHEGNHALSAGRATISTSVRIQDDAGQPLPAGTAGEVAARGDLVMRGYWRRPDATADVIRDGWFRTGDIGTLDEGGYLYLSDRKKDMIKTGGATVAPREVEDAIYRHPAVHEAVVFGVPDDEWGEAVKALVVLKPGAQATEAEIIETCRAHIASFKKPRSVEFVPDLPKSGTNKIQRRELRERYWKDRARKV